jgi:hypothetical protein
VGSAKYSRRASYYRLRPREILISHDYFGALGGCGDRAASRNALTPHRFFDNVPDSMHQVLAVHPAIDSPRRAREVTNIFPPIAGHEQRVAAYEMNDDLSFVRRVGSHVSRQRSLKAANSLARRTYFRRRNHIG